MPNNNINTFDESIYIKKDVFSFIISVKISSIVKYYLLIYVTCTMYTFFTKR